MKSQIAQAFSKLLVPLSKTTPKTSVDLLSAHGFVNQSGSGIYDLMPMGLRVQNKISEIVRRHLNNSGCTELELSIMVNPSLWIATGRLSEEELNNKSQHEFMFTENKKQLLAPTGEEQITTLVGSRSYRQLPLSLYQITRKFRNELRPRGGLLRGREFLMKDLYTFDETPEDASKSYERIKQAYLQIFNEIGVPFICASADSGSMGGNLSHEYHFVSESGEDDVVVCHNCQYSANVEVATSKIPSERLSTLEPFEVEKDVYIPKGRRLSPVLRSKVEATSSLRDWSLDDKGYPLTYPEQGDLCVECEQPLHFHKAVEVGHTFYLGDRYSKPLKALVTRKNGETVPISMCCYGIGITRIIGAVSEVTMDEHGLVWPYSIAPFQCVVVGKHTDQVKQAAELFASQGLETVYEDRTTQIGQAMRVAREMGIPYTVVLGRSYEKEGNVEILPRKSSEAIKCTLEEVPARIREHANA